MQTPSRLLATLSLALVASCAMLAWAVPPFAPEPGLLLLKNGQVLKGGILREGDRYVVTLGDRGEGGELRIPVADVDTICANLEEAYAYKRAAIVHRDVKPHVDLADWCLRNKMYDRAADELVSAIAIDSADPKIAALERRLKLATEPASPRQRPAFVLPPSQEEIEAAIRTLPPSAIEEFTSNIQPLLLSRCAATGCHGPNSSATYSLVRPPLRHANKTRETQRNLFATLAQIAPDGESPLLELPLEAHGGSKSPILDERDRRQVEVLAAWIEKVKNSSAQSPAQSKTDSFVRPANFEEADSPTRPATIRRLPSTVAPEEFRPDDARPLTKEESDPRTLGRKKPSAARDPFDPQPFNERYHGKK